MEQIDLVLKEQREQLATQLLAYTKQNNLNWVYQRVKGRDFLALYASSKTTGYYILGKWESSEEGSKYEVMIDSPKNLVTIKVGRKSSSKEAWSKWEALYELATTQAKAERDSEDKRRQEQAKKDESLLLSEVL